MPAQPDSPVLRFGVFELDPASGELRKNGNPVKLQPQPFRILAMLAQRSGEVVTREEIRQAIWGEDTYVDFDQSLNFCIRQIRNALNDSPDEPIFVQTLHRRGYRFLAPVERPGGAMVAAATAQAGTAAGPAAEPELAPTSGTFPVPVTTSSGTFPLPTARHSDLLHALAAGARKAEFASRRRSAAVALALIVVLSLGIGLANRGEKAAEAPTSVKERYKLVVLPFENMSGSPEQEYLSDGITEELSAQIARLSPQRLGVIARTAAMRYKRSQQSLAEIGRELGVDYVLEGSVRAAGDDIRVTAQLIQMSDQTHIWAESYNGKRQSVLEMQSRVAAEVAGEIRAIVRESDRATASAAHTSVPAAQEAYMRGRYYAAQYSQEGWEKACAFFGQAIEADPRFAAAYAGMARCQESLAVTGGLDPKEAIPKARTAAQKSLELDPALPEAHGALGVILLGHDWDWEGAGHELKRALELDPGSSDANRYYGTYVRNLGDVRGSLKYLERAQELDPLSASSRVRTAWTYGFLNEWEAAGRLFAEAERLDANFTGAKVGSWIAAERTGRYEDAVRSWEQVLTKYGRPDQAALMKKLYRERGYMEAKRQILRQQVAELAPRWKQSLHGRPPVQAMDIAVLYVDLGDVNNAMLWMERAYQERARDLYEIKVNTRFDPLRGDRRFQELLRKMGLS